MTEIKKYNPQGWKRILAAFCILAAIRGLVSELNQPDWEAAHFAAVCFFALSGIYLIWDYREKRYK